jgi:hypothetical protein
MLVRRYRRFTALLGLLSVASVVALVWFAFVPRSIRAAAESEGVDPKAKAALAQSAEYLRGLPAFSVVADVTRDEVVHGDFNVQRTSHVRVTVRRPDRLRIEISGDSGDRLFTYDGQTLSLYFAKEQYYVSTPAAPTLREVLDAAIEKHAIDVPLTDLIYIAMGGELHQNVRESAEIGPSRVAGADTLHLAFRGPTVDWQLWLEQGSRPLPRKISIATTDAATRPQYTATLDWDLSPAVNDELFQFTPPPGALPIKLKAALASAHATLEPITSVTEQN